MALASCTKAPVAPRGIEQLPAAAAARLAESFDDLGSAAVLAAALRYPAARSAVDAPLSLTASDGSGLALVSLEAEAVVEGPLAFTELSLRFRNPEAREREGRFRIALPAGAAVSRLAMRIDEHWQEAEVVERNKARAAYEDFLHRKQDPALLEKSVGNELSARVFPIQAKADKDLVLSYSQAIAETGGVYRLPLRGLPAIGQGARPRAPARRKLRRARARSARREATKRLRSRRTFASPCADGARQRRRRAHHRASHRTDP
jgi:hypothetical protein